VSSVGAEIKVLGMVQGVGYRYFCFRQATELGLVGWVRNNPDGTVSAYVEGDRGAIEVFIKELRIGPRSASVTDISVHWREFTGEHKSFNFNF